jgi:hypothetical protein
MSERLSLRLEAVEREHLLATLEAIASGSSVEGERRWALALLAAARPEPAGSRIEDALSRARRTVHR